MEDGQPRGMHPPAGAYQTKDGWLVFTLLKNEYFTCLCKALGHPELVEDPRYIGFEQRLENSAKSDRNGHEPHGSTYDGGVDFPTACGGCPQQPY